MSYGVGHRCSLDPTLLWLRCRLAAIALIWPLVWEFPYAAGMALKKTGKKRKKKKKEEDPSTKHEGILGKAVLLLLIID